MGDLFSSELKISIVWFFNVLININSLKTKSYLKYIGLYNDMLVHFKTVTGLGLQCISRLLQE